MSRTPPTVVLATDVGHLYCEHCDVFPELQVDGSALLCLCASIPVGSRLPPFWSWLPFGFADGKE